MSNIKLYLFTYYYGLLKSLEDLVNETDNKSMGTNSIYSLYEYGQISRDDELNGYNSDKDPEFIHPLEVNNHYTYYK